MLRDDANVLLCAVNSDATHHAQSRARLDGALAAGEPVGFAWTVLPTVRRVDVAAGLLEATGRVANVVNDAHPAALASEHAATITYDGDRARFAVVRSRRPGAP